MDEYAGVVAVVALTTAQRAGLVDQVIEQLRAGIGSGEWQVGQRIPTEAELVAQLGVGRNTVREAVRALAHTGILEVRQGDGTYVRATSEMAGAIRRLCGPELREVLQVRRALEVDGARLAATARTDADLAELRRLLERRDAAWDKLSRGAGDNPERSSGGSPDHRADTSADTSADSSADTSADSSADTSADSSADEFARADSEFHSAVVRSGHNQLLFQMHQGLMEAITASVATTAALPDHRVPDHDAVPDHHGGPDAARVRRVEQVRHRGLVAAIADSDPDRAAAEAARFLDELLALVGP